MGKKQLTFLTKTLGINTKATQTKLQKLIIFLTKKIDDAERTEGNIIEKGEFSKYDFAENAFKFLNINVQDALKSDNIILKALAVVDKKTGKRTLTELSKLENHPMIKYLIELRLLS